MLSDARDVYYNDNGIGLFPPIFNVAKHSEISVNGTCGSRGFEEICRRAPEKESRKTHACKHRVTCDSKRNGIGRVHDGSRESWISPTLANGDEFECITILIDMKQVLISVVTYFPTILPGKKFNAFYKIKKIINVPLTPVLPAIAPISKPIWKPISKVTEHEPMPDCLFFGKRLNFR